MLNEFVHFLKIFMVYFFDFWEYRKLCQQVEKSKKYKLFEIVDFLLQMLSF